MHPDRLPLDRREFLASAGTVAVATAAATAAMAFPDLAAAAQPKPKPQRYVIGRSRMGRPIHAFLIGDRDARCRYLVMGQMHGDEPAGPLVCRHRLLRIKPLANTAFWIVPTMNPDGGHRGTRVNAKSVDLNRNFPSKTWVRQGKGTRYYSGPRPASEPETRAIVRFFSKVVPQTIISIHQPLATVDFSGGDPDVTRWLARHLGLPVSSIQIGHGGGTMSSWYNAKFKKQTAVTVELPPTTDAKYRAHIAKVLRRHAVVRRRQLLKG